jgi:hypothetical protein
MSTLGAPTRFSSALCHILWADLGATPRGDGYQGGETAGARFCGLQRAEVLRRVRRRLGDLGISLKVDVADADGLSAADD